MGSLARSWQSLEKWTRKTWRRKINEIHDCSEGAGEIIRKYTRNRSDILSKPQNCTWLEGKHIEIMARHEQQDTEPELRTTAD